MWQPGIVLIALLRYCGGCRWFVVVVEVVVVVAVAEVVVIAGAAT